MEHNIIIGANHEPTIVWPQLDGKGRLLRVQMIHVGWGQGEVWGKWGLTICKKGMREMLGTSGKLKVSMGQGDDNRHFANLKLGDMDEVTALRQADLCPVLWETTRRPQHWGMQPGFRRHAQQA